MGIRYEARGLFDHGKKTTIKSKGFGSTNTNDGDRRVEMVKIKNDPKTAEHNFFNSQPVLIKYALNDALNSEVVMQRPGNPYGPIDSLVVGIDDTMRADSLTLDKVHARFVYEMSPEAQYKYWQVAFAELVAIEQLPDPIDPQNHYDKPSVFHNVIMENTTPLSYIDDRFKDSSGESPATSRTIYLPHLHVIKVDENWMKPDEWEIPHLDKEQAFIGRLINSQVGDNFLQSLRQNIAQRVATNKDADLIYQGYVQPEEGRPHGYSIRFDSITPDNILDHIDMFASFMHAHFEAYKHAAEEMQKRLGQRINSADISLIGQPAFRDFIYFQENDGKRVLTVRISPEIFSHGGVMEAAGVEMDRKPENTNPLRRKIVEKYRKKWVRKVEELTDRDKTFEKYRIPFKKTLLPRRVTEGNKRYWERINRNFPQEEI